MKGIEMKNTISKTLNDAADVVNFCGIGGGGGGCVDGGVHKESFAEEDHRHLKKGELEEHHVDDSKEEVVNDDEEEQQPQLQQEEKEKQGQEEEEDDDDDDDDDDVYEVEAIRRKRVHKGQLQYLIKWLDWPETTNTWEPLENLKNVIDLVASFEESLRFLKIQKHIRSATPHNLGQVLTNTPRNHSRTSPHHDLSVPDIPTFPQTMTFADEVENNGDPNNLRTTNDANDNKSADAPEIFVDRNEENDCDHNLRELKAMTTNGNEGENLLVHFQATQHSIGTLDVDGQLNGDCTEPVQIACLRGAKRRKTSHVKNFIGNSHASGEPVNTQRPADTPIGTTEQANTGASDHACQNGQKMTDHATPACNVVNTIVD